VIKRISTLFEDLDRFRNFITVRMFMEVSNAANINMKDVPVQILMAHGEKDQITSLAATKWFFEKLKIRTKN
jgi:alpha-beta hydrolase superfamily lysophospholipase